MSNENVSIVVLITTKDKEEASKICQSLLEKKLVACVNCIERVESFFFWKGDIDNEQEVLLVAKTKRDHFKEIVRIVKELHNYDVPEVIALPIIDGNPEYMRWIDESVR